MDHVHVSPLVEGAAGLNRKYCHILSYLSDFIG